MNAAYLALHVAYYRLRPCGPGEAVRQVRIEEATATYIVDLDREGYVLGVEVLGDHDPRHVYATVLPRLRIASG